MGSIEANNHPNQNAICAKAIPTLPAIAAQLVDLCGQEDVDIDTLAETLSMDPSLASKILQLANSAKFRRRKPVTNLKAACVVLGLKTLKIMSLSFSLASSTKDRNAESNFDFDEYWSHSICKAVSGRDLARLVGHPVQDEAFFSGLVGRIGQLAMANAIPEQYNAIIPSDGSLPNAQAERAALGFDLHDIGTQLLSAWALPQDLVNAVGNWGSPQPGEHLEQIIRLSDLIATVICSESKGSAYSDLHQLSHEYFGLTNVEVDDFIVTLKEGIEILAGILKVDLNTSVEYAAIMQNARQQMIELTLAAQFEISNLRERETELVTQAEELKRVAQLDALTGIPNRGEFDQRMDALFEARNSGSLTVFMADVDHFKSFNDTHGHLAGDEVLRSVAQCISNALRQSDFVARYGGEEFAVVITNADEPDAFLVGERIRRAVEDLCIDYEGTSLSVTISIGAAITNLAQTDASAKELTKAADVCLYKSKARGRNRVTISAFPSSTAQSPEA